MDICKNRVATAVRSNQSHLRIIGGKGLHSVNGISQLKPVIYALCEVYGLRHRIDPENSGVLVIDLTNVQSSQIPDDWDNSSSTQPQQAYHGTSGTQYQQQQSEPQESQPQLQNQSGDTD